MKKVIALVLALVMVLSLSTVAFAKENEGIFEKIGKLLDKVEEASPKAQATESFWESIASGKNLIVSLWKGYTTEINKGESNSHQALEVVYNKLFGTEDSLINSIADKIQSYTDTVISSITYGGGSSEAKQEALNELEVKESYAFGVLRWITNEVNGFYAVHEWVAKVADILTLNFSTPD